jgi:hypothetical protein
MAAVRKGRMAWWVERCDDEVPPAAGGAGGQQ